jgi:hypothetical protein
MKAFYERKRDEHHVAYLAAVEMEDEKLAAKHLKEYENNVEQLKGLS